MNTINYHGFELDSDPSAIPVYDEVIGRDCYRVDTMPQDVEHIIDIGAFHGEFMLWAHKHRPKASLAGYEPNGESVLNAIQNLEANCGTAFKWTAHMVAVSNYKGFCRLGLVENHPAGTRIEKDNAGFVPVVSIESVVRDKRNIAIKLDCEGSEKAIFSHLDWLEPVRWLGMEFHNHDGDYFADLLAKSGFVIGRLEGCQGDPWEPSMAGGIIIAWRPV